MSAKKKICNFSWKSLLKCKFSFAVSLNLLSLSILMRGMRLENVMCKRARSRVQLFTNSAVIVGCETRRRKLLLKPKISPGKAVSCEMLLQSAVACDITDLDNRRLVVEIIASGIPVAKIPSNAQRDDRNLSLASFIALLLISRLQN